MKRLIYATMFLALTCLSFAGGMATGYSVGYPQGRLDCEQNYVQDRQWMKNLLESKDQLDAYYKQKHWNTPQQHSPK